VDSCEGAGCLFEILRHVGRPVFMLNPIFCLILDDTGDGRSLIWRRDGQINKMLSRYRQMSEVDVLQIAIAEYFTFS